MEKEKSPSSSEGMSRRDFIKAGAGGGLLAGLLLTTQVANPQKAGASGLATKKHKDIDSVFKFSADYKRFDQKHTAMGLAAFGSKMWPFNPVRGKAAIDYPVEGLDTIDEYVQKYMENGFVRGFMSTPFITEEVLKKPGYTQLDWAATNGAGANMDLEASGLNGNFSNESGIYFPMPTPDGKQKLVPLNSYAAQFPTPRVPNKRKHQFNSTSDASHAMKKIGEKFRAVGVGITRYDERFMYKSEMHLPINPATKGVFPHLFNLERPVNMEKNFGFTPKSVIVFLVEMDYEMIKTTPSALSKTSTRIGYDEIGVVGARIAKFINELGYQSRQSMNDTGLNVPLAISAGLGEGSRMGLLISEKYGPRVRIGKVFTDLELEPDQPISFGVKSFCDACRKCADNCPSNSITHLDIDDPENKPVNRCNNPGVEKWYNDAQKCFAFWSENLTSCSNCIAVCPYNKIDEWHHDLAQVATRIPVVNRLARYLDEAFGYGKIDTERKSIDFWKKSI